MAADGPMPLALFRMDLAARMRSEDGAERQMLIEIQKAKAPAVIERFRAYLGQQYANAENLVVDGETGRTEAVPLVTIYLLGYDLGLSEEAVVDVYPCVPERCPDRELEAEHPFIEGIQHRTHIVQIPRLASRRRDVLERFLSSYLRPWSASRGLERIRALGAQPRPLHRPPMARRECPLANSADRRDGRGGGDAPRAWLRRRGLGGLDAHAAVTTRSAKVCGLARKG